MKKTQLTIKKEAIETLITSYCRESGVRNLQKHVKKIFSKAAYKIVNEKLKSEIVVDEKNLHDFVGKPKFNDEKLYKSTPIGVVMGLTWNSLIGGHTFYIEASLRCADVALSVLVTGLIQETMNESIAVAYTFAKLFLLELKIDSGYLSKNQIHIHIPDGGSKKDGTSAGCAIVTALLSLALNKPCNQNMAMTGEITLTGKILPVSDIKEKVIAVGFYLNKDLKSQHKNFKQIIL